MDKFKSLELWEIVQGIKETLPFEKKLLLKEVLNDKDNWLAFEILVNEKKLIHLPGSDLRNGDFSGVNFSRSTFRGANLAHIDITNVKYSDGKDE